LIINDLNMFCSRSALQRASGSQRRATEETLGQKGCYGAGEIGEELSGPEKAEHSFERRQRHGGVIFRTDICRASTLRPVNSISALRF
jgi:hypothetical protein